MDAVPCSLVGKRNNKSSTLSARQQPVRKLAGYILDSSTIQRIYVKLSIEKEGHRKAWEGGREVVENVESPRAHTHTHSCTCTLGRIAIHFTGQQTTLLDREAVV